MRSLAFCCLPHCVWAAPRGVSDLLVVAEAIAARAPEALPASPSQLAPCVVTGFDESRHVPSGQDSSEADPRYESDEQAAASCSPLPDLDVRSTHMCAEATPQARSLSGPGVFLVLCPYHQSTAVALHVLRPSDVEIVCN